MNDFYPHGIVSSLFLKMKREGYPLGISDYQTALKIVSSGMIEIYHPNELRDALKMIWLKSQSDYHEFLQLYNQALRETQNSFFLDKNILNSKSLENQEQREKGDSPEVFSGSDQEINKEKDQDVGDFEQEEVYDPLEETYDEFLSEKDEATNIQILFPQSKKVPELERTAFGFYSSIDFDHLPIRKRVMKQIWRSLRQKSKGSIAGEIDLELTILEICKNRFFLKPVLSNSKQNITELIFIIDCGGSMIPFKKFGERLFHTARHSGAFRRVHTYFFYNVPQNTEENPNEFCLFSDQSLSHSVKFYELTKKNIQTSHVIIFSDAGASRGQINFERVKRTRKFLRALKKKIDYVAWINPMPNYRWEDTSAELIRLYVDMFSIGESDFKSMIKYLRGKLTSDVEPYI